MDVYSETSRGHLFKALERNFRSLEPFRNLVRGLVAETAGPDYVQDHDGPKREQLLNLMRQATVAYTMSLAANRPQVLLSTHYPQYRSFARHFEQATNNLLQEIRIEQTIQRWVLDAFYCLGVVKVHMADSGLIQIAPDVWMDPGRPFASNVSLDNFCFDMQANKWSEVRFAADSYRIPFERLQDPNLYDEDVVKDLNPTSKQDLSGDQERLERISRGDEVDDDELEPMIDLMDVWVPADEKIYTFAMDSRSQFKGRSAPVAEMDWNGPEGGPYHLLQFLEVPDNIMPSSIAANLSGLSRLVNNLMRKQSSRAKKQKVLTAFPAESAEQAKVAHDATGDKWITSDNPDALKQVSLGGIDPGTQAFLLGSMDLFDRMAGNLQAKMGLGSGAPTLGQEQLLHQASSNEEAHMQNQVMRAVTGLVRDLGWMLWNDKFSVVSGRMPIEGTEYTVDATWKPDDREGDFLDYNFDIDVFSMSYRSPSQRLQGLLQILSQVYLPLMPVLQQQGGTLDMQELNALVAQLQNEPRFKQLVKFGAPMPDDQPAPSGEPPGMPSSTTREYIRRNVPTGGTSQSRSQTMQMALLGQGGGVNQDQMAALGRPAA